MIRYSFFSFEVSFLHLFGNFLEDFWPQVEIPMAKMVDFFGASWPVKTSCRCNEEEMMSPHVAIVTSISPWHKLGSSCCNVSHQSLSTIDSRLVLYQSNHKRFCCHDFWKVVTTSFPCHDPNWHHRLLNYCCDLFSLSWEYLLARPIYW